MANTRTDAVQLAGSQLGIHESPPQSNRTKYGAWFGLDGNPWCAMFVSWVLFTVGNASGFRFASTAASVAWAKKVGRLIPLAQAKPGDVVVHLYTSTTGHTGIIESVPGDGTVVTIEGNTSTANDRDGGTVMRRRRSASWWPYVIRLDYVDPAKPPPPLLKPDHAPYRGGGVSDCDCPTGGAWSVLEDGAIETYGSAPYLGGPNGQPYWGDRKAAHIEANQRGGYDIVATTHERYSYPTG